MNTLLESAIDAAKKAGDVILSKYAITDFDTKHDGSPVTLADHAANEILIEALTETNIQILSEESTGIALPYPERLWIIDPLDGTHDFIQKTGDFSVMIGLLEHGRPTLGVVYAPVLEELYYATQGEGAWVHNTRTGETTEFKIQNEAPQVPRLIRSRNHHSERVAHIAEKLNATIAESRGSVGIKAAVIAKGDADFYIVMGRLGEWDTCAPEIILKEAGGFVSDLQGAPLLYGNSNHTLAPGTLFAHPAYREKVLDAIKNTLQ